MYLFSAFCPSNAIFVRSTSKSNKSFNTNPVSTSIEAEDESPAPFGIVPKYTISKPLSILKPSSFIAQIIDFG